MESCWGRRRVDEFAVFSQDQQTLVGACDGRRANRVGLPDHFSRFDVDTSQFRTRGVARIGAPVDSIKKPVLLDAGGVMVRKQIITRPDFLRLLVMDAQQDGTGS